MKAIALTLLLAVAGCKSLLEQYPPAPDFCKSQGRRIPDDDKITIGLVYLMQPKRSVYERSWGLDAFTKIYRADFPGATDMDVARAYHAAYPGCCMVVDPVIVRQKDWPNLSDFHKTRYGYTKDIIISSSGLIRLPERNLGARDKNLGFKNCGEIFPIIWG